MTSAKLSLYLLVILVAATLLTVVSTVFTYRNSMRAAENSLKLQSLGIAVSLEASVARFSPGSANVFKDIITQGLWEGIAFIALYDKEGKTLLHSNENLIGRKIDDPAIASVASTGEPLYHRMMLGTGEEVFMTTYPVHGAKADRLLRVALHTFPVENIIQQARLEAFSTMAVLAILWVLGLFFVRAVKRSEALSTAMAERERFALLGEMASVLAHEIRNPLGSIKGFAQYLLEHQSESDRLTSPLSGEVPRPKRDAALSDDLHHKTSDYLTIIVSESQRLEELTEDLLVYARPVEARPLEFNLAATVQEVVESLRRVDPKARDAGMTVSIPESLQIETDQDKLRQIVANLLQNSLDAVPPGGSITVTARADRGRVTLAVQDNGPGMDAETLARAREPFFTTKTQGTGLGLAIVSRLTQALSGTIDIESAPAKGTTVTLTFPARVGRSS